jgi:2-polyprenyl-3-methyl-5-hydroxy-6-metoxy-1,4-benzoquinol methylase
VKIGGDGFETETEARLDGFRRARGVLVMRYPQIATGLLGGDATRDPELEGYADTVLGFLARKCEAEGRSLDDALEAMARISFDFLRLQPRFMKTGRYRSAHSAPLVERIYSQRDVMEGYYLDGLLLTYAFWVNHASLYRWFVRGFLPRLPREARVLEIGVGHGLMALTLLRELPLARYAGLDISPFSLSYAAGLLAANGIDPARVELREEDVSASGPGGPGEWDAVLCCEVLEHVEDPKHLLETVRARLGPRGRAFVTTVANVEAEDHIFLFRDEGHIRRMIGDAGLGVEDEIVLPLRGFEDAHPRPLNYAAVLSPAAIGSAGS